MEGLSRLGGPVKIVRRKAGGGVDDINPALP